VFGGCGRVTTKIDRVSVGQAISAANDSRSFGKCPQIHKNTWKVVAMFSKVIEVFLGNCIAPLNEIAPLLHQRG
jgi:hypothetical protein